MQRETQISAPVSKATKELLERHARATGVKKGHLVEEALQHHLQALQALPSDVIVHPRIVVSRRSGAKLLARLASTKPPAKKLRQLMAGDGD
jgi:uncharacterized protein (DUF1778 family)